MRLRGTYESRVLMLRRGGFVYRRSRKVSEGIRSALDLGLQGLQCLGFGCLRASTVEAGGGAHWQMQAIPRIQLGVLLSAAPLP